MAEKSEDARKALRVGTCELMHLRVAVPKGFPSETGVKRLALFIIEVSRCVAQLELASGSG